MLTEFFCNSNSFSVLRKEFRYRCKCSKKELAAKLSNNFNFVGSINLFHLDANEDILF